MRYSRRCRFYGFQHTAARRRLERFVGNFLQAHCFNTQPPEGGWFLCLIIDSTITSFNTQPPEGGWDTPQILLRRTMSFNTQPPEGGWGCSTYLISIPFLVSTHSRPKAAGNALCVDCMRVHSVSTHSRPKAAGRHGSAVGLCRDVSTHSRPKAAGTKGRYNLPHKLMFQHTAARRRLG